LPFVDQNPINPQSWNLYHCARNNPLVFTDPTGSTSEAQFCTLASCARYESNGGSEAAPTTIIDAENNVGGTDIGGR
jgi:hypothetical protein